MNHDGQETQELYEYLNRDEEEDIDYEYLEDCYWDTQADIAMDK